MVRCVKAISHGPNNDGCNPASCRDALIEDCLFDRGDDCRDVFAENCRMDSPNLDRVLRLKTNSVRGGGD